MRGAATKGGSTAPRRERSKERARGTRRGHSNSTRVPYARVLLAHIVEAYMSTEMRMPDARSSVKWICFGVIGHPAMWDIFSPVTHQLFYVKSAQSKYRYKAP